MGAFGRVPIACGRMSAYLKRLVGAEKLGEQEGTSLLIPIVTLVRRSCVADLMSPSGRPLCPHAPARRGCHATGRLLTLSR